MHTRWPGDRHRDLNKDAWLSMAVVVGTGCFMYDVIVLIHDMTCFVYPIYPFLGDVCSLLWRQKGCNFISVSLSFLCFNLTLRIRFQLFLLKNEKQSKNPNFFSCNLRTFSLLVSGNPWHGYLQLIRNIRLQMFTCICCHNLNDICTFYSYCETPCMAGETRRRFLDNKSLI